MNRGGLAGTVFEIDDLFTGYDAAAIARMGFDGRSQPSRTWSVCSPRRRCRPCCSAVKSSADQNAAFDRWHKALQMPTVHGLVVGRTLLFPPDDDVTGAVDTAVSLMRG